MDKGIDFRGGEPGTRYGYRLRLSCGRVLLMLDSELSLLVFWGHSFGFRAQDQARKMMNPVMIDSPGPQSWL